MKDGGIGDMRHGIEVEGAPAGRWAALLMAGTFLAAVATAGPALAQTPPARAAAPAGSRNLDIPAQALAGALIAFSRQTRVQIFVDQSLVAGRNAPSVSGTLAPSAALRLLLAGSGLRGSVVSALGTAFDVNGNLPGGRVAVAVAEHAVRVRAAGALPADAGIVVSRDEGVVIAADGRIGPVAGLDAAAATAWRSGMYVAEGRPLDEVVAALRAYRRGWIVMRDDSLKSLKVNAVLDLRTPGASLETLARGLPIRIFQLSPLLTVISGA
jgi:hypothetical protein